MIPYRVGILGCGNFANVHAQINVNLKDDVQLVAFSDHHEENAREFAAKYAPDAAIFTDHHVLFDQANLDIVIVCLPPFAHTDEVQSAAAHGVHILMEKPIALTSEHAWQMVEAVEQAGIKSQVGFMFRFGEAVERFKAMQAAGETGPVALMTARYFCNALHAPWWRMKEKSGGQTVEQIIHMFDLLRYLVGEPTSVYSRQENLFHKDVPNYTVEDTSATIVGFRDGGMGVIYATNNAIPGKWINDYRVVARHLVAEFQNANNALFTQTNQPDNPTIKIESEINFRQKLMLDLINAIRTNGETRTPMREGAKSLDLVLAARRSAETRTEVTL